MAIASRSECGIPGAWIQITYQSSNLRIQDVEYELAENVSGYIWIWNDGQLVFDASYAEGASGTQNIGGNHRMVLVTDENGIDYYELPAYLTWRIALHNT